MIEERRASENREREEKRGEVAPKEKALGVVPCACGWGAVVRSRGEMEVREAVSFGEALEEGMALVEKLRVGKGGVEVRVGLRTRDVVFERFELPSGEVEELEGMVRLQFEKSLPYALEETTVGMQILRQRVGARGLTEEGGVAEPVVETTVMACGLHRGAAESLCGPLRGRGRCPERMTPWALLVAGCAGVGVVACGLWREEGDAVFGIFEDRRLSFVEVLASPGEVVVGVSRALMGAEMAGVPVKFSEVLLDPALASVGEGLSALLGAPVRELDVFGAVESEAWEGVDMTPQAWRQERERRESFVRVRNRLAVAGALYAAVLVGAFVDLGVEGGRLEAMRREAQGLQPQVDALIERQARWKALAPASGRRLFVAELLFQSFESLPGPEARLTKFEVPAQGQFMIEGETPDAQQAIAYVERLKGRAELGEFRFEAGQPAILSNEHAKFRIFGKL